MLLHRLQNTASFGHNREVGGVKRPYLVHALQAQNHLLTRFIWYRANDQAGVATLGNNAGEGVGTGLHNGSDFLHIGWPDDCQGSAM